MHFEQEKGNMLVVPVVPQALPVLSMQLQGILSSFGYEIEIRKLVRIYLRIFVRKTRIDFMLSIFLL